MTSPKKLFTVIVEDKFSSDEALIFKAAQDACNEYSSENNWTNSFIEKSSIETKKIDNTMIYYFDVYGIGTPVVFEDPYVSIQSSAKPNSSVAAKEVSP